MIPLESPRWSELSHAYGDAADVPELLDRLSHGDAMAIEELFGCLCHQGTVYSASYAALPHLADTARGTRDLGRRVHILVLIGSIVASTDRAPMPADLHSEYEAAQPPTLELALETLGEPIEPFEAVHLLAAAASLDGRQLLGHALTAILDEELVVDCPTCHGELYLSAEGDGLTAYAGDPVSASKTACTSVVPGPETAHEADYSWLLRVGGSAALSLIAARLTSLFGRGNCPACGGAFSVMDQLAARIT